MKWDPSTGALEKAFDARDSAADPDAQRPSAERDGTANVRLENQTHVPPMELKILEVDFLETVRPVQFESNLTTNRRRQDAKLAGVKFLIFCF